LATRKKKGECVEKKKGKRQVTTLASAKGKRGEPGTKEKKAPSKRTRRSEKY